MDKASHVSILSYFRQEKKLLILTSITGIIYNVGMITGPLFEGQLAQYLFDILRGKRKSRDIIILSLLYVTVIAIVQAARALKRLYVRKFANNVTRSMKEGIFHHLIHESYAEIQKEDTGAIMTRAIADAESCAEGMRKFTTEIFDTGVVMIAYLVMLLVFDWRLTLVVILFPPIAYAASAILKKKVVSSTAESRQAMSDLNNAAVDSAKNALTYRIYGEDRNRTDAYETALTNYEKKNVIAGIWQNSPQPVYFVISMISVIPILYFGGRNVLGVGWKLWTIASFSSFLSCFTKLATKSSHAAKLFNAVQKAQVSWERIKDYLVPNDSSSESKDTSARMLQTSDTSQNAVQSAELEMRHVSFSYEDGSFALHDLNLLARPGEIIGITGRVASGKSTFGKLFLNEYPFEGKILFGGTDINDIKEPVFAYSGHDPELFTGTVRENIAFGDHNDSRLKQVLQEVQIDREVTPDMIVGMEGSELSGGQQARIALARALYSKAPVLILDDPFSAVDADTEQKIFQNLREKENGRIILLISHRLALFPKTDQIIFLQNGTMKSGASKDMIKDPDYASLYHLQNGNYKNRAEIHEFE
jgi:ATP-binding cassette subfamily B multidrug efflux pump